jgi:hypothetical protein
MLEGRRRIFGQFSREDLGADGRMRANKNALAALRAQVGFRPGSASARLRFSYLAVPVGQVPSTGNSETGSASPLPAISGSVTRRTKSVTCGEVIG